MGNPNSCPYAMLASDLGDGNLFRTTRLTPLGGLTTLCISWKASRFLTWPNTPIDVRPYVKDRSRE